MPSRLGLVDATVLSMWRLGCCEKLPKLGRQVGKALDSHRWNDERRRRRRYRELGHDYELPVSCCLYGMMTMTAADSLAGLGCRLDDLAGWICLLFVCRCDVVV